MPDGRLSIPALRDHVYQYHTYNGKYPLLREHFQACEYLPKYQTILKHFGSVENMYQKLDL